MLDNDKLQQCQQQSIVLDLLQFFCETTFDAMSQFRLAKINAISPVSWRTFVVQKIHTSKLRVEKKMVHNVDFTIFCFVVRIRFCAFDIHLQ